MVPRRIELEADITNMVALVKMVPVHSHRYGYSFLVSCNVLCHVPWLLDPLKFFEIGRSQARVAEGLGCLTPP